jgi:septum formation protein
MTLSKKLAAVELVKSLPIIALAKARDVARRCGPGDIIIGADTIVHYRGTVLGKPSDADEAHAMLRRLSNNLHRVYTSVAVISYDKGRIRTATEETEVRFRAISDEELEHYVASGEPMDKAGAYGIQGLGGLFVANIKGRYDNVVGLPLLTLSRLLAEVGIDLLASRDPNYRPKS